MKPKEERPSGWLGKLYDRIAHSNNNPKSELERLAKGAASEGFLDQKHLEVIALRLPFEGYERGTLRSVASAYGIMHSAVRDVLEKTGYHRLSLYIEIIKARKEAEQLNNGFSTNASILALRWPADKLSFRVLGTLSDHFGTYPTIIEVINMYRTAQDKPPGYLMISGYGRSSHQRLKEVFANGNIELPNVEVR